MNRISRMMLVGGLGLVASATMAVGPAAAATATDAGSTKLTQQDDRRFGSMNNDRRRHRDNDRRFGPYSYQRCQWIADRIADRWDLDEDEVDCERGRRGWYVEIDRDNDDWDWSDSRHNSRVAWFILRQLRNWN